MVQGRSIDAEIAELRAAARQARALSKTTIEPEARWGFAELADKWEAEADELELDNAD